MDRAGLTRYVKEVMRRVGFDLVGVTRAEALPPERLRSWLSKGYQGEMGYLERGAEKRLSPEAILPGARAVISVGLNYSGDVRLPYEQPDRGVISRYARGRDYHKVLGGRLRRAWREMAAVLPERRCRFYVDTGPVLDKVWAARSGLGWIGKHTNVIAGKKGSWFFIGEMLVDFDLEPDPPAVDRCGTCTRCIDACPTEAIIEPYVLDARRCISYLTIELRGAIPEEFRPLMKNLIFGCDICQDVCPWNRDPAPATVSEFSDRGRSDHLIQLSGLSPEEFDREFAGSAVRRARWSGFQRNVAIAMGNSGDAKFVPALERLYETGDPLVREHASWALRRLQGRTRTDTDHVRRKDGDSDRERRDRAASGT